MVVTVITVRVMKVTVDEVINMIAVRDRFVTTSWTVDVSGLVGGALMLVTTVRIRVAHWNRMLFNNSVFTLMMEMSVMEIIDVIAMLDGGVPAIIAMLVVVIGVGFAIVFAH